MIVMKGVIKNGLYTLIRKIVIGEVSLVQNKNEDKVKLWHLRISHISQKGLRELEKHCLLEKEKLRELPFCEDCIFGKATRVGFKMTTHQTKQTLDYIHSDMWEPSKVASHGVARYFLPIIDDC